MHTRLVVDELQRVVDELGAELERAVALDDDRMQLRAYSPHFGAVDPPRLSSLLHREADPNVVAHLAKSGIRRARRAVRIPAAPELDMLPRVCVTVWHNNERLGYLWLIDPDASLDVGQLARAERAAGEIATVIRQERTQREIERGRERELLRDLLSADERLRAHAAEELAASEVLEVSPAIQALVLRVLTADRDGGPVGRRQIDIALGEVRDTLAPRRAAQLAYPDHGVLLVVGRLGPEALTGLCDRLLAAGRAIGDPVVGVGGTQQGLRDAHEAHRQALTAARVANVVPTVGPVARWSDLGIYGVLAQLPAQELSAAALDPRLLALFGGDTDGVLTRTLETYLECGGDTRLIIDRLVLHRTSLYYRLDKIEKITGFTLADGDDRLAAHLGLKIARLAGVHPLEDKPEAAAGGT